MTSDLTGGSLWPLWRPGHHQVLRASVPPGRRRQPAQDHRLRGIRRRQAQAAGQGGRSLALQLVSRVPSLLFFPTSVLFHFSWTFTLIVNPVFFVSATRGKFRLLFLLFRGRRDFVFASATHQDNTGLIIGSLWDEKGLCLLISNQTVGSMVALHFTPAALSLGVRSTETSRACRKWEGQSEANDWLWPPLSGTQKKLVFASIPWTLLLSPVLLLFYSKCLQAFGPGDSLWCHRGYWFLSRTGFGPALLSFCQTFEKSSIGLILPAVLWLRVTFALCSRTGPRRPAAGRRHAAGLRHVFHVAAAQLGHSQEEAQHPEIQSEHSGSRPLVGCWVKDPGCKIWLHL